MAERDRGERDAVSASTAPTTSRRRNNTIIAFVVVALLAWLLLSTAGKDCHFNVHFAKKVVCTDDRTLPADDTSDRSDRSF
jgi:hypothetical protein